MFITEINTGSYITLDNNVKTGYSPTSESWTAPKKE